MPDWKPALEWAETHPQLAVAAIVVALAIVAITIYATRSAARISGRVVRAGGRAAKKLDLVVVGIAGVALLATLASIEAMWKFLRDDLHITDEVVRACIVGVFDLAAVMGAVLSREARVKNPDKFGLDACIVWIVALLLGYFGATEAATAQGQVFRFAIPLIAAVMWDRLIQRDVARTVTLDKARMVTVTGRITATIGRVARAVGHSVMRTLARLGLVQPDEDIAQIQHKRWRKRFIDAAAKAAAAKRCNVAAPDDEKASKHRAKAEEKFAAVVAAGQRNGAVNSPADLKRLLWEARVVLHAADALDQTDAESPWRSTDRSNNRPVDTDRPDVIDGEVIDQPTDRSTGSKADRAAEQIEPNSTDRPAKPTDRPVNRPTDSPTPVNRPTDRPDAIARPTRRRSKEENEQLIRDALVVILADADTIEFPSHGAIAGVAGVSKSTVAGYLGRVGLSGETQLTATTIDVLPVHNI